MDRSRHSIPISVWQMTVLPAGTAHEPAALPSAAEWVAAIAPGTSAAALREAGRWSLDEPMSLMDREVWWRARFRAEGRGVLQFEGLATLAEVFIDGERILASDNMFLAHAVPVVLTGEHDLLIRFAALDEISNKPAKRARWRPAMIQPPGLRNVRTTLLGHMPGWCPPVHAVGPWRPVYFTPDGGAQVVQKEVRAFLEGSSGVLRATVTLSGVGVGERVTLSCGGATAVMQRVGPERFAASLAIDNVHPWWPHTHGEPHLYPVALQVGGEEIDLGHVGFRHLAIDHGADGHGFALRVNGEPVFCRGACWTPPDIVGLGGARADYEPHLRLARDAGMNMLRVPGFAIYESDAFFDLCDALGILVWQDFMFANFDYPVADEAFAASVRREAEQFLTRTQMSPALAVLSGGSEMAQQAAMLGLPASAWTSPLTAEILPAAVAALRPDVPYIENSPSGGELPFVADSGVTHYYGVGAYCRPLTDARRAEVRFAAECLAFANVPEEATLDAALAVPAVHHPRWKERVPRDRGASWDFEDVRDHYLGELYGVDPARLRREDPTRYLDLSRAVTGEVMAETFAEWRRSRSPTAGALVFLFKDPWAGAGWGVVDATGEPKPAYWALKRAFRPVQITLTDEGVNGLAVHVLNETAQAKDLALTLTCLRDGAVPVVTGRRELTLAPRSGEEIKATTLFGAFFDTTYCYRFGPPSHDVTVARLTDRATGALVAEAFHFPLGRKADRHVIGIRADLARDGEGWFLALETDRLAQSVHLQDPHFQPEDNWFHLAPGDARRIRLRPRQPGRDAQPAGMIAAVNAIGAVRYGAPP
ncbi:glycoside hydrolase family 2 protein [Chelatococcus sp. GCM10030263]|uniref:glycoside hydrolase family 2 protein n=1 Tax=Chelatococcus sp. GCM10030263 TaxID=3273387 RepID=UPI00360A2E45